jgi:hypothetical protein
VRSCESFGEEVKEKNQRGQKQNHEGIPGAPGFKQRWFVKIHTQESFTQSRKAAKKNYSSPFTIRLIPSLIKGTVKFINKPNLNPVSFKYVLTCLNSSLPKHSIDFSSINTLFSTNKSARKALDK